MAKLIRYFIEYKLVGEDGAHEYIPIGVWTHDPQSDDMDIRFLPEFWEDEFEANQPTNRLIEQNLPFPPDFFDYWNEHIPSHRGRRDPIQTTLRFDNVVQASKWILERLVEGNLKALEALTAEKEVTLSL